MKKKGKEKQRSIAVWRFEEINQEIDNKIEFIQYKLIALETDNKSRNGFDVNNKRIDCLYLLIYLSLISPFAGYLKCLC